MPINTFLQNCQVARSIFTICAIISNILYVFPRGDCYDAIKFYAHNCYRDRSHPFPGIIGRWYLLHCSVCKNQENNLFNRRSDPDFYNPWTLPIRHLVGIHSKYYGRLRSAPYHDGLWSASHQYSLIKAGHSAKENDQSPL